MSKMVKKFCRTCGKEIEVRQADVDRGWGKHCSKSCVALGRSAKRPKRVVTVKDAPRETIDDYDGSWDAHNY
jgi:hypothetical protein